MPRGTRKGPYFQLIKPEETISDEMKKICLIRMCPLELAKHLQKDAKNQVKPEEVRAEISDWIARDNKHRAGGLLARLQSWVEG